MPGGAWVKIGERKRAERAAKIPSAWNLPKSAIPSSSNGRHSVLDVPRTCGLLTEEELDITENYDATALGEAIAQRRLKSVDVTRAFCKRAAIAQQVTNCLTEIFFSEALTRAATLDAHLDAGRPPLSPLHGVPISLKDTFHVRGTDASIGIASLCFDTSSSNSTLVDILLAAGAVIYCKTNIPQTLTQMDSHNNVFGRTLNPHNAALTAGGSTGGEGALIAMRGSVLGVGTDVGGSIRVPAMCNALYGVKPSWQRVSYAGQRFPGGAGLQKVGLAASAGPLAVSMRDCELFLRVVSEQKAWEVDADIIPGVWSSLSSLPSQGLRVGLVMTDGLITPLPPIIRLLHEVAGTLRAASISVTEINCTSVFSKCQSLANALLGIFGGVPMFDALDATHEPLSPWLQGRMKRGSPVALEKVRELLARREELEKQFLRVFEDVDVLLCPVAPHPVPPIDRFNGVSYTIAFNLMDYPAGTIPVRKVQPDDLRGEIPAGEGIGSWDKANRGLWTNLDRTIYTSSPLCVQVVAPKLQERRLCEAMARIDSVLKASYSDTNAKGAKGSKL